MAGVVDDPALDAAHRQRPSPLAEVGGRQDGCDAGDGPRGLDVDRAQPRVRVGTAHERGLEEPGELDVVEVRRLAAQEADVLAARHGPPDPALGAHRPGATPRPPRCSCDSIAARTTPSAAKPFCGPGLGHRLAAHAAGELVQLLDEDVARLERDFTGALAGREPERWSRRRRARRVARPPCP